MASYAWLNRALAGSNQMPAYSPYGSYDSNNLDSQNMRGNSALAFSRVQNSGFFPYAASQAAMAGGGPVMYQSPTPRMTPAPAALTPRQQIEKRAEEARKATEQRYTDTLAGYDARRADAMNIVANAGMSDAEQDTLRRNKESGIALRQRGLGNSSEATYSQFLHDRTMGNLAFDKAYRLAQLDSGLAGDRLRVMESRNDTPPDLRAAMEAERDIGSGTTEGLQYPGGPPAISGNPYGMQRPVMQQPQEQGQQQQQQQGGQQGRPYDPVAAANWVKAMNRQVSYGETIKKKASQHAAAFSPAARVARAEYEQQRAFRRG